MVQGGGGGGGSALNLPRCVSMKVMDMGLFWLQVSEVSRHVSTHNKSQICPSTPFGGFLGHCPFDMGLFQSLP